MRRAVSVLTQRAALCYNRWERRKGGSFPLKPICFVISPIGLPGSEVRQNADDLLDFIIKPALEIFDFQVVRGDHRSEPNQIDVDVIQMVQDAQLCICDVTGLNPNVMYELGRRDETMKDVIVMKKIGEHLPIDLGSRRCIEYDLSTPRSAKEAQEQIRSFVEPMIQRGFDSSGRAATLRDIVSVLDRMERKVDSMRKDLKNAGGAVSGGAFGSSSSEGLGGLSPLQAFRKARQTNDLALIEVALANLQKSTEHFRFLDQYVEVAASMGSNAAGNYLIECFREFMDSDRPFREKYDYIAYLITYAGKTDREPEIVQMVEDAANGLLSVEDMEDSEKWKACLYNQLNRLYWGVFLNTAQEEYRLKTLSALSLAVEYDPNEPAYYFNIAVVQENYDFDAALDAIEHCLTLEDAAGQSDLDHLEKAYKLYKRADDPRSFDMLERIRAVNPDLADYLANYAP